MRSTFLLAVLVSVVVAGCSQGSGDTPTSTADATRATTAATVQAEPTVSSISGEPDFLIELPGAVAANVASNGDDMPAVTWITSEDVIYARLDTSSGSLSDGKPVNGDFAPVAHPIERPAVAVAPDGTVHIAFTSGIPEGSVFSVTVENGTAGDPAVISGDPRHETVLPAITVKDDGKRAYAWLEDSTLSTSTNLGEHEGVDDLTCDCCNPAPIFVGEDLVISYRDLENLDEGTARDIAVVISRDAGETFEPSQRISDDHWFIQACPFTGPSTVIVGDSVVVAWMDARQSVHPDQSSSTIWVDRSDDGGVTFGTDLAVASGAIHRWPVMAVDANDTIHMVWETHGPDGGMSYSASSDEGRSFQPPTTLLASAEYGSPTSPSIAHHDGLILLTWTAGGKGFLAGWTVAD